MRVKYCGKCKKGVEADKPKCCHCGYSFLDGNVYPLIQKRPHYTPCYPSSLDEAISMLQDMHNEETENNDFCNGYRMGLRIGMNAMMTLLHPKGQDNDM